VVLVFVWISAREMGVNLMGRTAICWAHEVWTAKHRLIHEL